MVLAGVWLTLPIALALMAFTGAWEPLLRWIDVNPAVVRDAVPYLKAITWSAWPLLLYAAFRRYLQAINLVEPVMFALVTANVVNVAVNWVLIFGHLGAPAMGVVGAGWATTLSRVYMAAALLAAIVRHEHRRPTGLWRIPLAPDLARLRRLTALGLPAALQLLAEVGVFATATALAGRLDAPSLASHMIAMHAASFTFMVPLGISAAAAVRVGQALGRRDLRAASLAGWTALLLGGGFMAIAGVVFLLFPRAVARLFSADAAVISRGATLLVVAAFFQLFDGLQVVATGTLRGAADTRTPMICHLVAYWFVGLPLGWFLCFHRGWGATGIWVGLCVAVILIGVALSAAWRSHVQSLAARLKKQEGTADERR